MRHALDDRLTEAVDAFSDLENRVVDRGGEIGVQDDGSVRWLLLDNPRAHNALTVRMMRRLAEEVRALQAWDGAFVAIGSAHGGSFCAGGHLAQVRGGLTEPAAARVMVTHMTAVLDALGQLPFVSVSVLQGAAIGGGVELASATDLRVASPDAFLDPAQVRLGVACGWGGAERLVRILGRRAALAFLARSRRVPAAEAHALGLVDELAHGGREAMLDAALGPMRAHSAASIRAVKRQVLGEDPAGAFLEVWGGPAHRAALYPQE